MIPGVDPKVDYAFKWLFGREENLALLVDLLNAVLKPPPGSEIVDLVILNPFNDKETLDDKLSILDIKARDQQGRLFNVEMQMLAEVFWKERVVYYWARLHPQQLHEGEGYRDLHPTISVCFINATLFPELPNWHLRFRLWDDGHRVLFTDTLDIHMLEIPKVPDTCGRPVDPLEAWMYFLRHADKLDTEALPEPVNTPIIHRAMEELKVLAQDDVEREKYEARMKAQRDHISFLKAAETRGEAAGLARGLVKGLTEGRAEGDVSRIHLCQRLLKRALTPKDELLALASEDRQRLAEQLEMDVLGQT